jgi:hypothetical protein
MHILDEKKLFFAIDQNVGKLPLLATLLIFYRCYIPGQSMLNYIGILIWIIVICRRIFSKIPFFKKYISTSAWKPRKVSAIMILLLLSFYASTEYPILAAFKLFKSDLNKFAQARIADKRHFSSDGYRKNFPLRLPEVWLGLIPVTDYAVDPTGAVYIVTTVRQDGLGPDTISIGFAYKPNSVKSPFGKKYYHPTPIGKGWYLFEASDDY